MKKKIVFSSAVAIILCVALLAGATFALFTSKDEVNIAATAGKVNVVATIENMKTFSMDEEQPEGKFENGGTAVLDKGTLTLDKVTPGDRVEFDIVITNNSNVAIQYNTKLAVVENTGLFEGLVVKTGEEGNQFILTEQSPWTTLQPDSDPVVLPVSIELPKEAGDEYQETKAAIRFAVEAVQANGVEDSDLVVEDGVITLYTVNDLITFSRMDLSDVEKVALGADIDLAGHAWTPLSLWDSENSAVFEFDGKGHTISNLSVAGGGSIGFIGSASRDVTIKNLTFKKANVVTTGSFAGVVIGYQYGDAVLENVKVIESNVATTAVAGIRLGGLVGFSVINDNATIKVIDCAVQDSTITGFHNVAGLVGTLMSYESKTDKWTLTGNEVTGTTINVTAVREAAPKYGSAFAVSGNQTYAESKAYFEAEAFGNKESGNTFNYVDMSTNEIVLDTAAELMAFAKEVNGGKTFAGKTIKLAENIDLAGYDWAPIGATNGESINSYPTYTFAGTFDGQGNTISSLTCESKGGNAVAGLFGSANRATIKNVILDGANIKSEHYAGGILAYDTEYTNVTGCTVINSTIISSTNGTGDNGDKVGGIVGAMTGANAEYAVSGNTVENCIIYAYRDCGGIIGFAAKDLRVENNTVKNVVINQDVSDDYKETTPTTFGAIVGQNDGAKLSGNTDTECKVNVAAKSQSVLNNAIANANPSAPVKVELAEGTYTIPAATNKDITFTGTKDTVIDLTSNPSVSGATLTFDGVTVVFDNDGYEGLQHSDKVVYKNVAFVGTQFLYAENVEFENCTFDMANATTEYSVWTYGAKNVKFTNCTFNTNGKAVLVYIEGEIHAKVTLDNCKFYGNGKYTGKAAVEVGASTGDAVSKTTYKLVFTNCTAEGFVANNSTSPLWGNKNSMSTDQLSVIIDGKEAY